MTLAQQKAKELEARYGMVTDFNNRLSYANGIKNIIGMRKTNMTIRTRITNPTDNDVKIYIMPRSIVGIETEVTTTFEKVMLALGLDKNGIPFFAPELKKFKGNVFNPATEVDIRSLDSTQSLILIASSATYEPFNLTGISMKSFTMEGEPESSNYGNAVTHYNVSAWREKKRSTPINFQDYQSSKDFSTEIMKIDFVEQNFTAPVSQSDILEILVNAGTKLDFTMHVGARDSVTERFYRDIKAGTVAILNGIVGDADNCGCK